MDKKYMVDMPPECMVLMVEFAHEDKEFRRQLILYGIGRGSNILSLPFNNWHYIEQSLETEKIRLKNAIIDDCALNPGQVLGSDDILRTMDRLLKVSSVLSAIRSSVGV